MHKRRSLLALYGKLIIHGVIPIFNLAVILQYYTQYYTDYGDIMKYCLHKCRDIDKLSVSRGIVNALINVFNSLKDNAPGNNIDPVSDDFSALRELAKRLSVTLGADHVKNRDAVATVHREGIVFAMDKIQGDRVRPSNIAFLEVLQEFSNKLVAQDKLAILRYLEKHVRVSADVIGEDAVWQPYLLYRNSLQDKDKHDDVGSVRSVATVRGRGGRGGRGRAARIGTPTPSEFDND